MRTVSAFSVQFKVSDDYNAATQIIADERAGRSLIVGLGFGSAQMAQFCTFALLLWYGATLIGSGEVSFVEMMQVPYPFRQCYRTSLYVDPSLFAGLLDTCAFRQLLIHPHPSCLRSRYHVYHFLFRGAVITSIPPMA
jgi:hypothetical protein